MNKWVFLIFLIPYISLADVGLGLSNNGLVVGDFNLFDQQSYLYGLKRYGDGFSRLEIGNMVGVSLASNAGIYLLETNNDISPFISGEFATGRLILNTNRFLYEFTPQMGAGIKMNVNPFIISVLVKGGSGLGNVNSILPSYSNAYGYGFYCTDKLVSVGYQRTNLSFDRKLENIDIQSKSIGIRFENNFNEKNVLLLLKFKLE